MDTLLKRRLSMPRIQYFCYCTSIPKWNILQALMPRYQGCRFRRKCANIYLRPDDDNASAMYLYIFDPSRPVRLALKLPATIIFDLWGTFRNPQQ